MSELNYDKLKAEIANPSWKQNLRPLWEPFHGAHTPHRHRANFLSIYSMFLAEVPTFGDGIKLLKTDELFHLCGRHSLPIFQTLIGMVSRIRQTPTIEARYSGFKEYLYWILPEGHAWVTKRQAPVEKEDVLAYPYIRGTPTDEHATLLEIHKLLPKYLPADHKGEICQDVFVALLSGETTMANLPDHIGKYVKASRKNMPEYGTISLDESKPQWNGATRLQLLEYHRGKEIKCC